MSKDVEKIFQDFLTESLSVDEPDFEHMIAAHPEQAEILREKAAAYRRMKAALPRLNFDSENDPFLGKTFGGCRIKSLIRRGGMGAVYYATQESLNRNVALKILHPSVANSEASFGRFRRESHNIAKLDHENILPVYDVGTQDGFHYVITKYVSGVSLEDVIHIYREKNAPPTPDEIAKLLGSTLSTWKRQPKDYLDFIYHIMAKTAEALAFTHSRGIIHRDVKPSNILLKDDGEPVLIDFGLSRDYSQATITMTGEYMGTPVYSAPEQLFGLQEEVDERADVYSLGMTFYELATGHLPFAGKTFLDIATNIKMEKPRNPYLACAELSQSVADVILQAISYEREKRFSSIGQLISALQKSFSTPHFDQPKQQGIKDEFVHVPPKSKISERQPKTHIPSQEDTDSNPPLKHSERHIKSRRWLVALGGTIFVVLCITFVVPLVNKIGNKEQNSVQTEPNASNVQPIALDLEHAFHALYEFGSYSSEKGAWIHTLKTSIAPIFEGHEPIIQSGNTVITTLPFMKEFVQDGFRKTFVVISTLPYDDHRRNNGFGHADSPYIGIAIFHQENEKWIVETRNEYLSLGSDFGATPDIEFLQIGPDRYGTWITSWNNAQGVFANASLIGQTPERTIALLTSLDKEISYENPITSVDYKSSYSFSDSNVSDGYYDLLVVWRGNCNIGGGNTILARTQIYTWKGSQFYPSSNQDIGVGKWATRWKPKECVANQLDTMTQNYTNNSGNTELLNLMDYFYPSEEGKTYEYDTQAPNGKIMTDSNNILTTKNVPDNKGPELVIFEVEMNNSVLEQTLMKMGATKTDYDRFRRVTRYEVSKREIISRPSSLDTMHKTMSPMMTDFSNAHGMNLNNDKAVIVLKLPGESWTETSEFDSVSTTTTHTISRQMVEIDGKDVDTIVHTTIAPISGASGHSVTKVYYAQHIGHVQTTTCYGVKNGRVESVLTSTLRRVIDSRLQEQRLNVVIEKSCSLENFLPLSTNVPTMDFVLPNSDKRKLDDKEVSKLTYDQLSIARNEIFARHGYVFTDKPKSKRFKDYFEAKSWYQPDSEYDGSINEIEKYNVDLIKMYESILRSSLTEDFNGDSLIDEVRKEVGSNGKYVIQCYLSQVDGSKRKYIIADWDEQPFLDIAKKGTYKTWCGKTGECNPGDQQSITLRQPGISYGTPESSWVISYWDQNQSKFIEVWISD